MQYENGGALVDIGAKASAFLPLHEAGLVTNAGDDKAPIEDMVKLDVERDFQIISEEVSVLFLPGGAQGGGGGARFLLLCSRASQRVVVGKILGVAPSMVVFCRGAPRVLRNSSLCPRFRQYFFFPSRRALPGRERSAPRFHPSH